MAYYGDQKGSPWAASSMHFNPNQDKPAFQREYKALSSSGILMDDEATQTIIKATSSTIIDRGNSPSATTYHSTHYLWGIVYVTGDSAFAAGHIKDEDGVILTTCLATNKGPFFIAFDTPLKVTENSAVVHHRLAYKANTYCTPLYTTTHKKYSVTMAGTNTPTVL